MGEFRDEGGEEVRGGGTKASHGISNGLALAPTVPGSGGGAYSSAGNPGAAGGGLVRIEATNSATIDGAILADGVPTRYAGAGAGGGIFIRAPRFAGGSSYPGIDGAAYGGTAQALAGVVHSTAGWRGGETGWLLALGDAEPATRLPANLEIRKSGIQEW